MHITIDEIENAFIVKVLTDSNPSFKTYSQPKDSLVVSDFVYKVINEEFTRQEEIRKETMEGIQKAEEIRAGVSGVVCEGDIEPEYRSVAQTLVGKESFGKDPSRPRRRR